MLGFRIHQGAKVLKLAFPKKGDDPRVFASDAGNFTLSQSYI